MIKALLFDLDGTLLNTLDDITLVMNELLEAFGCQPHSREAYRWLVGRGLHNLVYDALPEAKKHLADAVYSEAHARFAHRGVGTATLYPGVLETLDTLYNMKIPMAVVSNKPEIAVTEIITELNMNNYFFGIYGGANREFLKPHPQSVLPAITTIQTIIPDCKLSEIALLGDSDVDIVTAKNTGIVPLGAGWGFRGIPELAQAGAAVILMSIQELIPLINIL